MYQAKTPLQMVADQIIEDLERIVLDADRATKPLELPPYRPQLFELFARATATGLVHEDADPDLSADGVLKTLAERLGLTSATRDAFSQQAKLPPEHLAKMRLLWSLLRMWMEWTYAWDRWAEYHGAPSETEAGSCGHDHDHS
ncbi:MAG: hypothetical protein JWN70_4872 [Planctomycetaceae bacterium]|nr:hypothetical protein [Planctomycetaceae bacterium]